VACVGRSWSRKLPFAVVLLIAVIGLVFGSSPALAAAQPVIERFTVPVDQVGAPHHDCINEPVHWTGWYDLTIRSVQDASGAWHRSLTYVQHLPGVGLESGQTYRQVSPYHETTLDSPVVRVYVFTQAYLEISLGADGNYLFHEVQLQVGDSGQARAFINCVG